MAVREIAHKPELTSEAVEDVFRRHFEPRCKVEQIRGVKRTTLRRDFMVVKSAFIAVSLRLEQGDRSTKLVYSGLVPRSWARLITVGGILGYIMWRGLTHEVEQLIDSAPEFH
jgi:hypothetical protein